MRKKKNLFRDLGFDDFDDRGYLPVDIDGKRVKTIAQKRIFSGIRKEKKMKKTVLVAAALCAAAFTTVFASDTIRDKIGDVISYFKNDSAAEISSLNTLSDLNSSIGKSVSRNGFTFTLDNVAADDNFLHVFYTAQSEKTPFYNSENRADVMYASELNVSSEVYCTVNGKAVGFGAASLSDGYFEDAHTYKGVKKYSIADENIPDKFSLELYCIVLGENDKSKSVEEKLVSGMEDEITDEERNNVWYIKEKIDKTKVRVKTTVKSPNLKLWNENNTLEKIVISPFGNQLVISSDTKKDINSPLDAESMALFDENGKCLDILNKGLSADAGGITKNTFEFLKVDLSTKEITLMPVKTKTSVADAEILYENAGNYPMRFETSDSGAVVVTNVRIKDGEIAVDYYKDGFVRYDPPFYFENERGENIEPGGKFDCVSYTDVHYETNSYTARYSYEPIGENANSGGQLPESVRAEYLERNLCRIGTLKDDGFEIDKSRAVTVSLK